MADQGGVKIRNTLNTELCRQITCKILVLRGKSQTIFFFGGGGCYCQTSNNTLLSAKWCKIKKILNYVTSIEFSMLAALLNYVLFSCNFDLWTYNAFWGMIFFLSFALLSSFSLTTRKERKEDKQGHKEVCATLDRISLCTCNCKPPPLPPPCPRETWGMGGALWGL